MKILIITQKIDEEDWLLGFFHRWVEEMAKRLERIYVIALEKGKTRLPKNVSIYPPGEKMGHNRILTFLKFNLILTNILSKEKIDIIFIHMCPKYAMLTWPYARLKNIPIVIWYAHGGTSLYLRFAHLLVNRVITSSKDGFRIDSKKLTIAGQGIDIEKFRIQNSEFSDQNNGKRTILSVGRISPVKDYETLIKAADILVNQKNIKDLRFQIIGGTPIESQKIYLDFLKDRVRKYKLDDYVQFVGPIPYTQIQDYYQNCDLFASTCNIGFDKTVLEAMACGKVVLTSNEAFMDILGKHGKMLIFEKKNATQLADNIVSLLNMGEEARKKLEQELREMVVQKHSIGNLVKKLVEVFIESSN